MVPTFFSFPRGFFNCTVQILCKSLRTFKYDSTSGTKISICLKNIVSCMHNCLCPVQPAFCDKIINFTFCIHVKRPTPFNNTTQMTELG